MPKATKVTTSPIEDEKRKFCIEMAIRWPVDHVGNLANAPEPKLVDADVIGRAQKIYDWLSNPVATPPA